MFKVKGNLVKILGVIIMLAALFSVLPGCGGETSPTASPTVSVSPTTTDFTPLPAVARLKVGTTTSLYDTGLWGYLEPMFEDRYNVEVDVLSLGSGAAFEYAKRGDVDVLTIHDKPNELKFISDNYGIERIPFAYNYFLIVGPETDPAGIKGMSPEDAFRTLKENGAGTFVSRGDNSGTHSKEKAIWAAAGYDYATQIVGSGDWYIEAGSSMGATLNLANEKQGYTLADMGTYVSYKSKLDLVPIVDQGAILLNVYSVIVVDPAKVTTLKNVTMAQNMADFLTSAEIQDLIGKYGVTEYQIQLFTPCAGAEPSQ
jgi:tungstate transport system substrate-binding protein